MTIKKKIFYSNTIMVFLSLLILLGIGGVIISLFKDEFFKKINEGSVINENIDKVEDALSDSANANLSMREWSDKLQPYGFRIYALDVHGKKIWNSLRHNEKEAIEEIKHNDFPANHVIMYFMEGSTIVAYNNENGPNPYTIIAASSQEDFRFWGLDRGFFEAFIIVFFVLGILAIIGILLCSQFFTKRLIKEIMKPLDIINATTERIVEGNLEEMISYDRLDEFKQVCDSVDLMQVSLKESKDKQLAYEKARTEMVSGISHDLRTPLTSIKGYVKGMLDGIANTEEKRQHYLATVYKKSCDMDTLLTKLFYFSKLETGNMPFYQQKTQMRHMMEEYVSDKKQEIDDKNIEIVLEDEFESSDNTVFCNLDKDQTRRVFDNLIENSIKYAQTEQLVIRIRLRQLGDLVNIQFADNGIGLSTEKLKHVFEQFYRGDESRTSKNDGSGLGLYVCKYIIEQQGGTIEAASDKGFCVSINIPTIKEEEGLDGSYIDRRG